MKFVKLLLLTVLIATLGVVFLNCGDDDDTTGAGFTGTVIGFGSDDVPVPGVKVIVLDNETAEPLAGFETNAGDDGSVEFDGLPGERVGFKVFAKQEGDINVIDTYQFNIRTDAQGETLWSVPMSVFLAGPMAAQLEVDETKAIAAGGAYWLDENGSEFPIECAILEVEGGGGDVRYFNDAGFPSPIGKNPSVNKSNGYWIAANLPPGKVTVHAKVGDEIVGSTTFHAYAGTAISIGNIEADPKYTSNPGKCE